jgi:lipopolysaccharide export system protein LptA
MMRFPKIGYSLFLALLLIVAFHVVSVSLPQPETRKKKIEMLNSDLYTHDDKINRFADRLIGNVILGHNRVLLYCDSAYLYNDSNKVDAFGHVHIVQGDSLNLYGTMIKYEGNTRIATILGNVKLVNKSITLTTDELVFDMKTNIGNYHNWGKIVDTANVLVSKIGRYYSDEDLCLFKDSVKVTNKDFVLKADTLKYQTKTERVILVGPTHIVGTTKQGTLYSEKGWYDTRKNVAELYKASRIMGKEQTLQGDTIFYSKKEGTGRARSRVLLSDTTNHIAISGRTGTYNEKTKIAFVTDSAIFMQFSKKDTLFLHADTLKSVPDLPKKEAAVKKEKPVLVAKKAGSAKNDSAKTLVLKPVSVLKDSARVKAGLIDTARIIKDTLQIKAGPPPTVKAVNAKDTLNRKDTLQAKDTLNRKDTLQAKDTLNAKDTLHRKDTLQAKDTLNRKDTLHTKPAIIAKDSVKAVSDTGKVQAKIPAPTHRENPLYKDSLQTAQDTVKGKGENDNKLFMAYHRVRFYKKDLSGLCDSLSYTTKDSVMRLFKDPILWSDVHQMTAEKIEYRPHKPGPDIARLENNGFIISREDSVKYNQITGKTMIGNIVKNELKSIEVNGNAVTLYYIKNKNIYSGMNKLESSKIDVFLLKGKIDVIDFYPKPEGKTIPIKELTPDDVLLKGFEWRESEKPKNRFDLYPLDEKRKKIAGPEKKPASKKEY